MMKMQTLRRLAFTCGLALMCAASACTTEAPPDDDGSSGDGSSGSGNPIGGGSSTCEKAAEICEGQLEPGVECAGQLLCVSECIVNNNSCTSEATVNCVIGCDTDPDPGDTCALGANAFCACLDGAGEPCTQADFDSFYGACNSGADNGFITCFAGYVDGDTVSCGPAIDGCGHLLEN